MLTHKRKSLNESKPDAATAQYDATLLTQALATFSLAFLWFALAAPTASSLLFGAKESGSYSSVWAALLHTLVVSLGTAVGEDARCGGQGGGSLLREPVPLAQFLALLFATLCYAARHDLVTTFFSNDAFGHGYAASIAGAASVALWFAAAVALPHANAKWSRELRTSRKVHVSIAAAAGLAYALHTPGSYVLAAFGAAGALGVLSSGGAAARLDRARAF